MPVPGGQSTPSSAPMPSRIPSYAPYGNPPAHYYNPPPSNPGKSFFMQPTTTPPWATPLPTPTTALPPPPTNPDTQQPSLPKLLPLPLSLTAIQGTLRLKAIPQVVNHKGTEADKAVATLLVGSQAAGTRHRGLSRAVDTGEVVAGRGVVT